jgi:hypothetical protein
VLRDEAVTANDADDADPLVKDAAVAAAISATGSSPLIANALTLVESIVALAPFCDHALTATAPPLA